MQITSKLLKSSLYYRKLHVNRCDVWYLLRRKMSTNGDNDRLVLNKSISRLKLSKPLNLYRIVAVASMLSTNDKQHNLAQVQTIIEKAKQGNAKVIGLSSFLSLLLH